MTQEECDNCPVKARCPKGRHGLNNLVMGRNAVEDLLSKIISCEKTLDLLIRHSKGIQKELEQTLEMFDKNIEETKKLNGIEK